jgi:uncharacterized protein (TIGR03437 family)
VQPDTLFRIASLSKPVTSTAILKLVEQGKLKLEDRAFTILDQLRCSSGGITDARVVSITVQQLLHHTAGFDRSMTPDPMFQNSAAAQSLGMPGPVGCQEVIRWMLSRNLDFAPGARYAYSNFGYCILGRIIEKVSGMSYENYVRQEVLAPMGIQRMRLGKTQLAERQPGETLYFMPAGAAQPLSLFPPYTQRVPWPYGGWAIESMDSHGGWIASAPDLVRFLNQLDGQRGAPFLSNSTYLSFATRPLVPLPQTGVNFYGFGWSVNASTARPTLFHQGSLDGTSTYMVKYSTGLNYAVVLNMQPNVDVIPEIDRGMNEILGSIPFSQYPDRDLFSNFLSASSVQMGDASGVVNGASFTAPFAPGSWVTIRGTNLAPATRTWRADEIVNGVLPTELDGVSVRINGKAAAMYFISPGQLNVQAPGDVVRGPVKVEVIRNGVGQDVRMGDLRTNAPALFTYAAANQVWAAAVHLDGAVAGPESVPGTRPVRPGDRVLLFGTGFGPSTGGTTLAAPIALTSLPTVTLRAASDGGIRGLRFLRIGADQCFDPG